MDSLSEHEVVVRLLWSNLLDLLISVDEQKRLRMYAGRCTRLYGVRQGLLCEELLLLKSFGIAQQKAMCAYGCDEHGWKPVDGTGVDFWICPECHWRDFLSLEDVKCYVQVREELGFWSENDEQEWREYVLQRSEEPLNQDVSVQECEEDSCANGC